MTEEKRFILGVIPARGGSKGVPRKNVRLLGEKPLISYTVEAAKASKYLIYTVVSTDDDEIAQVARECGADVPFMRPPELAQDDSPIIPVLIHALEEVEPQKNMTADPVVLLQPSSPFRSAADIDACIERFFALEAEAVYSAQRSYASPYYNLVETTSSSSWATLCKESNEVLYRRQHAPPAWITSGAVITYARNTLYTYRNSTHQRMRRAAIFEMPEERILEIDSERDLMWAEFLLAHPETIH